MRIYSWNVNGIRAVIKKGFIDFLNKEKPDVLCLQEIKISDDARAKENFDFDDYQEFYNSAIRPGYSGTAILVRNNLKVLGEVKFPDDLEGRVQALEFEKFFVVNIYFPNSNHELSRLPFKLAFNNRVLKFLKKLEKKKPVIVTGDFNVAHEEIDLTNPKNNVGNPGFTDQERDWMTWFLKHGFVDTFRHMHPEEVAYTWWSYRFMARERDIGWRIDYFCVSDKLKNKIKCSFIMNKTLGSDHCPIGIEI